MKKDLLNIIEEFGKTLTKAEYYQYVTKLRDYFVPYILENKAENLDVDRIFKDEFTRNDIINATVYYVVENENVESLSAIDDYLIAMNRLFDELLFERYPNPTLLKFKPFTSLSNDIQKKLKEKQVVLRKREASPSINRSKFEFIIEYLRNYKVPGIKTRQVKIIIRLMLLYGFSYDKIANFIIDDYDPKKKTLKVAYKGVMTRNIYIELPYLLVEEIDNYLNIRSENEKLNSDLLFVTEKNNSIKHDFLDDIFDGMKTNYYQIHDKDLGKNQFTPTGLQKYAIIQMILNGMNQSIIMNFTGQGSKIFIDCQNEVDRIKELDRNRYINYKIRSIKTYDEM